MDTSRSEIREFKRNDVDPVVHGFIHLPGSPAKHGLVLTHGAGSNCSSPLLVKLANAFCDFGGFTVLRCDLPFRQSRPHGPPGRGSADRDQHGLRNAVEVIRREQRVERIFLGGHSYGGRQASMLVAESPGLVSGLLLLSYPLHPPHKPEQMRTEHFSKLRVPALFVHGVKDSFATSEEMLQAMRLIQSRTELMDVAAAGHELIGKRTPATLVMDIVEQFSRFVEG